MYITNKHEIAYFIRGFSGQDDVLHGLLHAALYHTLQIDRNFLRPVQSQGDLDYKKLKDRFERVNTQDWYKFEPDQGLKIITKLLSFWLMTFMSENRAVFSGSVIEGAQKKLYNIRRVEDLLAWSITGPVLTPQEIENLKKSRHIALEERTREIRHIQSLSGRYELFKIITKQGLKSAAKKADNCLWDNNLPDRQMPHKQRFSNPSRWLYFTIRDADNSSVLTLVVDQKRGMIITCPNGRHYPALPIPSELYPLKEEAELVIHSQLPTLKSNRPYGTQTFKP